ncbi:MAG: hypothetical protein IT289_06505 [Oligoflexia bacterium]|nr:hypothetical protein [Oligoflexia bacterium]
MDKKSTAIIIGVLAILTWFLLMDLGMAPNLFKRKRAGYVIGNITQVQNTGQQRRNTDLYWLDARIESSLSYYDSLVTLDDSQLSFELTDGTQITLDENTLVILEPPESHERNLKLVLIRGDVRVKGTSVAVVAHPEASNLVALVEVKREPVVEPKKEVAIIRSKPKPIVVASREPEAEPEELEPAAIPKVEARLDEVKVKKHVGPWWAWVGLGFNYSYYSQTISSFSDSAYQSFRGPSIFVRLGRYFLNGFGFDFSFKDSPGGVSSSTDIAVSDGEYHWRAVSLEGLKQFEFGPKTVFGMPTFFAARAGLQHHFMPFIAAQSSGEAQIRQNTLTLASLGFDWMLGQSRKLHYEVQGRYQYPISAGASGSNKFSVTPSFVFDGSVGAVYKLTETTRLGAFWYGQWHNYSFKYYDTNEGVENLGSQVLFYSNAELRLGIYF